MAETSASAAPEVEDLLRWAGFGQEEITFPILSDPGWGVSNRFERDGYIPTYSLIGRDMELLVVDGSVSASDIEDALAAPVPDVEWNEPPSLSGGDDDASADDEDIEDDSPTESAEPAEAGPFGGGEAPSSGGWVASPFGGCSASLAAGQVPAPAALLLLLGAVGLRRRRSP